MERIVRTSWFKWNCYISQESNVKVYSLQGKLLKETFGNEVDLSGYAKGMYLLDVEGKMFKVVRE